MANLTNDQVMHVAKLAQLQLSEAEIKEYKEQLSEVLDYVEQLQEVDTDNIEPTAQTTGLTNIFREDQVDPMTMLNASDALSNANKVHNDFFMVDLILKNKNDH